MSAQERRGGWADALREYGLQPHEQYIVEGDWGVKSGAEAFEELIRRNPDMSAVFANNDQMALGVLHSAEQMSLKVPDDLAVVGYDDIPEAAFFSPALSSVRQNLIELGGHAVEQVIKAINTIAIEGSYAPESAAIKPELVIRASSRKVLQAE